MSCFHVLTLSIAEGLPGSKRFEINCLNVHRDLKGKMVSFEKSKQEIFTADGKPIWDLGRITLVENFHLKKEAKKNKVYYTEGKTELLESKEISKETLKQILEANVIPFSAFKKDPSLFYAVIKPRKVLSIDEDKGEKQYRKQRMTLDFEDNYRKEELLNKDYRWIHYWRQIPDEIIYTRQDAYVKWFNQPGKNLYLIIRKYCFDGYKDPRYWISGMHWL